MSKQIFRGWFVVAACFLCMLVSGGIGWSSFPVFVPALEAEFAWTHLQFGLAVALWAAVGAAFSPVVGRLVDRFGSRWTMLIGVATGGLTTLALAEVRALSHLYAVLVFAALTTSAATYVPVTNLISRWFLRQRGLAMGIAMTGMGLGGFLIPNLSSFLIQSVGWRWTYRVFGIMIWVVLLPAVALWVHGRPSDLGLEPDGDEPVYSGETQLRGHAPEADGFSSREAFTMPRFWMLGLADFTNAIPVISLGLYLVVFSIQQGIGEHLAAFAYSSMSAASLLGILAAGIAANRFSKRIMISICYGAPALAVFFLFGLQSPGPLFCFVLFSGFCAGVRTTLWPLVVNDCFGGRAYSTVLGFLIIFYNAGSVLGPPIAGHISDRSGSFDGVFVLSIAAFLVSGVLIVFGAKPSRRRMQQALGSRG
jgi:MFS family permease